MSIYPKVLYILLYLFVTVPFVVHLSTCVLNSVRFLSICLSVYLYVRLGLSVCFSLSLCLCLCLCLSFSLSFSLSMFIRRYSFTVLNQYLNKTTCFETKDLRISYSLIPTSSNPKTNSWGYSNELRKEASLPARDRRDRTHRGLNYSTFD